MLLSLVSKCDSLGDQGDQSAGRDESWGGALQTVATLEAAWVPSWASDPGLGMPVVEALGRLSHRVVGSWFCAVPGGACHHVPCQGVGTT